MVSGSLVQHVSLTQLAEEGHISWYPSRAGTQKGKKGEAAGKQAKVIALQETHHATQAEAAQWCREGAGPTAPWDGPSFWAAGTSASRGVALLFKACPLLSRSKLMPQTPVADLLLLKAP